MLFDEFKPIVEIVLNNWTALQLAVEHGMGAPGGTQTAQLMAVYVTRYLVENGVVEREDLTEVLEDLMDEEFETVCRDNSPREVATLLIRLISLLRQNNREELVRVLNEMPRCELWLCQPYQPPTLTVHGNPNDLTSSSDSEGDEVTGNAAPQDSVSQDPGLHQPTSGPSHGEPMDQDEEEADPGWTVVKGKRKK